MLEPRCVRGVRVDHVEGRCEAAAGQQRSGNQGRQQRRQAPCRAAGTRSGTRSGHGHPRDALDATRKNFLRPQLSHESLLLLISVAFVALMALSQPSDGGSCSAMMTLQLFVDRGGGRCWLRLGLFVTHYMVCTRVLRHNKLNFVMYPYCIRLFGRTLLILYSYEYSKLRNLVRIPYSFIYNYTC